MPFELRRNSKFETFNYLYLIWNGYEFKFRISYLILQMKIEWIFLAVHIYSIYQIKGSLHRVSQLAWIANFGTQVWFPLGLKHPFWHKIKNYSFDLWSTHFQFFFFFFQKISCFNIRKPQLYFRNLNSISENRTCISEYSNESQEINEYIIERELTLCRYIFWNT